MQIHSDAYLSNLVSETEVELSRELKIIFGRISIEIISNQSLYTLPDNLEDVIDVSWYGETLESRELSDYDYSTWYKPNNLGHKNVRPDFFSLSNYGRKTIQFYPVPFIANYVAPTIEPAPVDLFSRSGFLSKVCVSGFFTADTTSDTYRLPQAILRNTIKYKVLERAFLKQGVGQDLTASNYFKSKNAYIRQKFQQVYRKVPKLVLIGNVPSSGSRGKLPRPQLPTTGAWGF